MQISHLAKILLATALGLGAGPHAGFSGIQSLIYYSDQEHPPEARREPPYEGTRLLIEMQAWPSFYLNVRYPVEDPDTGEIRFLISVGHEISGDLTYEVENLELLYYREPLDLHPEFINTETRRTEEGMAQLRQLAFSVPAYEHHRIYVTCTECRRDFEQLEFKLRIKARSRAGIGEVTAAKTLYRGVYWAAGEDREALPFIES